MAGILIIQSDVHACADTAAFLIRDMVRLHQTSVSRHDFGIINLCDHTLSADFFYSLDAFSIDYFAIGFLNALANRMRGIRFRIRRISEQFFFRYYRMMDSTQCKFSFCHRSCLVKDDISGLCQCFQIIGAFYQNPSLAGTTDTGKKGKRNTDDKGARTADHQESQRSGYPLFPHRIHA